MAHLHPCFIFKIINKIVELCVLTGEIEKLSRNKTQKYFRDEATQQRIVGQNSAENIS